MADAVLGITGKDFAILAADATAGFSIIVMKQDEDKILNIDKHKILAANGENGDRVQFTEYVKKNLSLYKLNQEKSATTHAAAHFIRGELATALRRRPYNTNLLLAGFDPESNSSSLYFMDYLASMQKVKFGAHGYGAYFSLSLMDKYHKEDLTRDEGLSIVKACINEIQKRLILNSSNFTVKVVDKDGIHVVDMKDIKAIV
mmetsp:Transcript_4708/g.6980  ORF Transcript_4708/g.6980 Transcript_4708/m.6980 type:complete len:202 (+) Transcript_4708:62-667(+)|eukprot:CAMPEP_0117429720 /NCGR_PEP_ID=MMETSP0758-20121206/9238_1 /TAXON_ID=63605 /ORGANISM="Percolomonas cosmopolitus, Strain AE-1 (ATCC 50343)" /LENGTH=201 /DNA_ID=CAMNT_0005216979 /DNA_START=23 /DNA_END=628 /DNA_ORIENTATION=+